MQIHTSLDITAAKKNKSKIALHNLIMAVDYKTAYWIMSNDNDKIEKKEPMMSATIKKRKSIPTLRKRSLFSNKRIKRMQLFVPNNIYMKNMNAKNMMKYKKHMRQDKKKSKEEGEVEEEGSNNSTAAWWWWSCSTPAGLRQALAEEERELQEAVDVLAGADLQTMANAAGLVSSAAARAALEAYLQGVDLAVTCRNLEVAARELSLAVAAAAADSQGRDESRCKWILWLKKDRRNADVVDDGRLGQALLHHKAWPVSNSLSTASRPEENLAEFLSYALFGSLTLLPYLDPAGPVMKTLSKTGKLIFHVAFSVAKRSFLY
ncbi:hypothetical protein TRIUR3_00299 [Triticum urartu]|uniref:Uncharacterized protein n=1 Tax=Triticum urartu TaxID=4572 RepID=M7ZP28_TRIUA|nr:hypothetical protein TRIUR3_00299 [Triticum urartu]